MTYINRPDYGSMMLDGFKFLHKDKEVQMPKAGWTISQKHNLAELQFHLVLIKEEFKRWENNGNNKAVYLGEQLFNDLTVLCAEVLQVEPGSLRIEYRAAKVHAAMPEHSVDLVAVCGA